MNAQQLKNSILQEAIEGRLVPQDPNDEPASVLLDKIRKEKAKLVKEGKLKKKDLEEIPIADDEKPFDIPESWVWCRLGDVGIFERGNGIKRDETSDYGYPCVRYGEMYTKYKYAPTFDKTISFTNKSVFDKCRKAHKGDLFMALTGENKQDISLAAQYTGEEEIAVGGDLCHLTIFEAFALYFVYIINSKYFSSKKELLATGDIIVHISTDKLSSIPIPLPPLAEQHRIVAKIEELLPKVEEYGKAQEALDKLNEELPERLNKSILQEAIEGRLVPQDPNDEPASVLLDKIRKEKAKLVKEGKLKKKDLEEIPVADDEKPFEVPDSWEWVHLKVLCNSFIVPQRDKPTKFNGDIPWCRIEDIEGKYLNGSKSNQLVTKELADRMNMHLCPKGTVICACSASIGNQAITTVDCYTNQTFIGIVCNDNALYNEYLYYFFMSQKQALKDLGKGTTISYISRKKFEDYLFPLPPLAEQHRIVAKIEQLMNEIDKLKK